MFSFPLWRNDFSQISHRWGFLPAWTCTWSSNLQYVLWQNIHFPLPFVLGLDFGKADFEFSVLSNFPLFQNIHFSCRFVVNFTIHLGFLTSEDPPLFVLLEFLYFSCCYNCSSSSTCLAASCRSPVISKTGCSSCPFYINIFFFYLNILWIPTSRNIDKSRWIVDTFF